MLQHLHIVCLDVPYPPDYGGAIDMMCRIKALYKQGIKIHLHYFSYNDRGHPTELNRYCESIHAYARNNNWKYILQNIPYIVASRISEELVSNLNKDNFPVLLEGTHCTGLIEKISTQNRRIIVRLHNEESIYYNELAKAEKNIFKKAYFKIESRLLDSYNHHLPKNCTYAAITEGDAEIYKSRYHLNDVIVLPPYTEWNTINSNTGLGTFCLFHGNLSVAENEKAAIWLLTKVFPLLKQHLIIAGKNPTRKIKKLAHLCDHTCLVANPSEAEMLDLIQKAHINVLPCFNKNITGLRLKLLHALFEGRHCVANEAMVRNTGLEQACHIGTGANAFASIISQLYHQPFCEEEINLRKRLLTQTYNTEKNTELLIQHLYC